jgi:hypothetical protein
MCRRLDAPAWRASIPSDPGMTQSDTAQRLAPQPLMICSEIWSRRSDLNGGRAGYE